MTWASPPCEKRGKDGEKSLFYVPDAVLSILYALALLILTTTPGWINFILTLWLKKTVQRGKGTLGYLGT